MKEHAQLRALASWSALGVVGPMIVWSIAELVLQDPRRPVDFYVAPLTYVGFFLYPTWLYSWSVMGQSQTTSSLIILATVAGNVLIFLLTGLIFASLHGRRVRILLTIGGYLVLSALSWVVAYRMS